MERSLANAQARDESSEPLLATNLDAPLTLTSRSIGLALAALLIAGCADDDGDGSKPAAGASTGAVGGTGAVNGTGAVGGTTAAGTGGSVGGASGETGWAKGSPCVAELVPLEVGPEGYPVGAIPGGSTAVLGCFTPDGWERLSRADRDPGPTCAGVADAPCVAPGVGSSTPCTHACLADEDCGANQACLCLMGVVGTHLNIGPEGTANKCIPAECTGPQDCDGWACGYSHQSCRGNESFHCRGPDDDCQNSEDCAGAACLFSDQNGKWMCMSHGSCP